MQGPEDAMGPDESGKMQEPAADEGSFMRIG